VNHKQLIFMATPAGFEPATCPLGGGCSIQLSHGANTAVLRFKKWFAKPAGFQTFCPLYFLSTAPHVRNRPLDQARLKSFVGALFEYNTTFHLVQIPIYTGSA
jgi:hypothetical protein